VVIELFNSHIQSREIQLKLNKTNKVYLNLQAKYLTHSTGQVSHFGRVFEVPLRVDRCLHPPVPTETGAGRLSHQSWSSASSVEPLRLKVNPSFQAGESKG
jgi:hypothetical protein